MKLFDINQLSRWLLKNIGSGFRDIASRQGDVSPSTPSSVLRLIAPRYLIEFVWYFLLSTALTITQRVIPVAAQPAEFCNDPGSIAAAETTRELQLQQFGITLTIPSNFRAILRNDGSVEIVDPGTYELLNCIAQGGEALGRGYTSTTVRSQPNPDNTDLRQLVEQTTRLAGCISPYTWNEKRGYLVQSQSDRSAQFWVDTENTPGAVVISTSCDCEGMTERLVTLLERS